MDNNSNNCCFASKVFINRVTTFRLFNNSHYLLATRNFLYYPPIFLPLASPIYMSLSTICSPLNLSKCDFCNVSYAFSITSLPLSPRIIFSSFITSTSFVYHGRLLSYKDPIPDSTSIASPIAYKSKSVSLARATKCLSKGYSIK